MLTTEPALEVSVSMVTTTRRHLEDKTCHVVLKPTPQRSHAGVRVPADGRPRVIASFSSAGTGAFTAYVPAGRPHDGAASPHPAPAWAHVGDLPYLPSRVVQHLSPRTDSDGNSDFTDQDAYPIDLRHRSKKTEVPVEPLDHSPAHESEVFPKERRLTTQREEQLPTPYSSLADIKREDRSPVIGEMPQYRHQSVIMRNSFCQNSRSVSPERAEYKRYTFRNNTARAEVFEMKSSYAPVNDAIPNFAGRGEDDAEEQYTRVGVTSPGETTAAQSVSCDSDEEIDVVSDDYLHDDEERYLGDCSGEDSADSEPQALDFSGSRRGSSSPSPGDAASPSSGSPSSSDARSTEEAATWLDPQDHEASYGLFALEDLLLRNRVLVMLWSLLGEARLLDVGYPRAPVHRILWLTVDVCCSVAGMKSAAAVPLPSDHDCRDDMLCFRDHTHRFLEVCAPTRDMWKQFGWAGLTVDAVVRKIYEEELRPRLSKLPADKLPRVVQRALLRLDRLEEMYELHGGGDVKISLPPVGSSSDQLAAVAQRVARADNQQTSAGKKKRGRPAKAGHKSDPGRIERVMLWRFLLNLLEDPRNRPCIHWVQRDEGIFRILNTDWLARLWGRRHGNPRMTYEKMARAMRTYYRSKVLQPVPRTRNLPRKLIYKFNPAVIHKVSSTKYAPFSDRGLNYNTTPAS